MVLFVLLLHVITQQSVINPQTSLGFVFFFSDTLPELVREYPVGLDPCFKAYGLHCIAQSKSSLSSPLRASESET